MILYITRHNINFVQAISRILFDEFLSNFQGFKFFVWILFLKKYGVLGKNSVLCQVLDFFWFQNEILSASLLKKTATGINWTFVVNDRVRFQLLSSSVYKRKILRCLKRFSSYSFFILIFVQANSQKWLDRVLWNF